MGVLRVQAVTSFNAGELIDLVIALQNPAAAAAASPAPPRVVIGAAAGLPPGNMGSVIMAAPSAVPRFGILSARESAAVTGDAGEKFNSTLDQRLVVDGEGIGAVKTLRLKMRIVDIRSAAPRGQPGSTPCTTDGVVQGRYNCHRCYDRSQERYADDLNRDKNQQHAGYVYNGYHTL